MYPKSLRLCRQNSHGGELDDLSKIRESCGIYGVVAKDPAQQVSKLIYDGLMSLQHRGQEAAGISVNSKNQIYTYKQIGMVSEVLVPDVLKKCWGNVSIGHCRYGTAGSASSVKNAQPYQFESTQTSFSIAFNGNIANYDELKIKMVKKGRVFNTNSDTEVIANVLASISIGTDDWVEKLKILSKFLDGAYSLVLMTKEGDLYSIRDPMGFKPLCYGVLDDPCKHEILSSESCAIDTVGGKLITDIKPGEIVHFSTDEEFHSEAIIGSEGGRKALCMFEFVYFARPDSIIDGVSVAKARMEMGRNLAKTYPVDSDNAVVVPVPDSGRSASIGYAEESGHPYAEGLMKNRYVWRTFIMPGQNKRISMVRQKLNPVKSIISGKEVILIDDSIVRGNTTNFIVKMLKQAGASKVHVRIACPPIREPCYMGVDFPTKNELIAGKLEFEYSDYERITNSVREKISADTLGYQTIAGLVKSIGKPINNLCLACLNGDYPLKNDPRKLNLEKTFTNNRE
jgi:amidophosphoribosyltransferase